MIPLNASLQMSNSSEAKSQSDASSKTGGGGRASPTYNVATGGSKLSATPAGDPGDMSGMLWIAGAAGLAAYLLTR